ncbi:hypothetical protein [Alkalicoccus urumqiensis]|uniref:Uncharacterized protein n=1 Tax=Alkalicoccus urumqiensis TaxID=1548213 RepID=A0A2P6MD32_ALKUR|nr:hypothetical protein [Alkalicoccus urumqiensis]PRO64183.1 hypothetical protein C6I21_16100 [Alkalicoccus urumqiensis]
MNKYLPLIGLLLLVACNNGETDSLSSDTPISERLPHADYNVPNDLQDLETDSEDIVTVRVNSNERIGYEDEEQAYVSTLTNVEILEVHAGSNYNEGDETIVSEPYYVDFNGEYQQLEGYVPMEEGREYLLFLRYGDDEELDNGIVSLDFGKYSVGGGEVIEESVTTLRTVQELDGVDFMKDDSTHVELYSEIKDEALEKYSPE